jgi:hypothetical protein
MTDLFVSLGTVCGTGSWVSNDCGFVGNLRKLYILSHGHKIIPMVTKQVTLRMFVNLGCFDTLLRSKA